MNSNQLYFRLLRYVKPYWRMFALSMFGTIVVAATEPAMPALLKPMLDGSFVAKDQSTIVLVPLLLVALFVVRGIASYVSTVGINWVASKVVMDLREEMFHKLIALPAKYYDDYPAGNLISKVAYDVSQVTQAATNTLIVLVRDSLAIAGLLGWMLYLNWKLSLVAFLVVPPIAFVVRTVSTRLRSLNRSLQQNMGDMTHVLEESLGGNRVVKIFNGQQYEADRFNRINNWIRRYQMKLIMASAINVPVVQLVAVIALAVIVYIASLQSIENEITVGGFVSFFGAMAMLFSPLKRLTNINEQLQRGLAAAESVFGLIDELPETDSGTVSLIKARGKLEFRNVSLAYDGGKDAAIKNFNLVINPGETVALVGPSGSGKTSLINLIPRFYCPTQGQILLDDIDIVTLRLADLRANLALVSQDVLLFNDTIAANIAYGSLAGKTDSEISHAAEKAYAMEFIQHLPQGLQTPIGANGVRLSGGQRQRLAIARALLKNAPLLILDEATSALDTQSEHQIQAALDTLRHGRTTLVIAHRLSTIEKADRIVVMHKGEIVETGSHADLLANDGVYAALYRNQIADSQSALDEAARAS